MSIRLQTGKRPSNALFYFREEDKTGIAPTHVIIEKQLDFTAAMVVTVNWNGEKVDTEILALDSKSKSNFLYNLIDFFYLSAHIT